MQRLELVLATLLCLFAGAALAGDKPAPRSAIFSAEGRDNVMIAQSYLGKGDVDGAEQHARAALASDPGIAWPHVAMALVLERREQHDKAGKEFERALALSPNDGGVLNTYGAWLCGRGDAAGADYAFRRALEDKAYRSPFQALVNAGRCAVRGGDWPKGEAYLRRAIAIEPVDRSALLLLAEAELKLGRAFDARAFVQRSD
ncbi:MAG: tetratricopeptide repeat protein, partial [Arenimonas sp.]